MMRLTFRRTISTDAKRWLLSKLLVAGAVVAASDWLLYSEWLENQWPELSLVGFFIVLAIAALLSNLVRATAARMALTSIMLVASLLPLIEAGGLLQLLFAVCGTSLFALTMTSGQRAGDEGTIRRVFLLPFCGVPWLCGDVARVSRLAKRRNVGLIAPSALVVWVVPILLFAVFLGLFYDANPLIENAVNWIELEPSLNWNQPVRFGFWMVILCLIWPWIHVRNQRRKSRNQAPAAGAAPPTGGPWNKASVQKSPVSLDALLGEQAIVRTLLLCNGLFAVQTLLDGAFLWGGLALPDGMTYATYAHRGAYPLVATALLAGGFVLVAMRAGGPADKSRLIRPLVVFWSLQNIGLVISSIERLRLYVAAFSLTNLRVGAAIWMILVLIGLVLVVVQIVWQRSISWLVHGNALSLIVVLYASCFINFPYLEARYNVDHCREVSGSGARLDLGYLVSLGPQVIPALDSLPGSVLATVPCLQETYKIWIADNAAQSADWRSWGFRAWRLHGYLSNNPLRLSTSWKVRKL